MACDCYSEPFYARAAELGDLYPQHGPRVAEVGDIYQWGEETRRGCAEWRGNHSVNYVRERHPDAVGRIRAVWIGDKFRCSHRDETFEVVGLGDWAVTLVSPSGAVRCVGLDQLGTERWQIVF